MARKDSARQAQSRTQLATPHPEDRKDLAGRQVDDGEAADDSVDVDGELTPGPAQHDATRHGRLPVTNHTRARRWRNTAPSAIVPHRARRR